MLRKGKADLGGWGVERGSFGCSQDLLHPRRVAGEGEFGIGRQISPIEKEGGFLWSYVCFDIYGKACKDLNWL